MMTVYATDLDSLVSALDSYSTQSTLREKHLKTYWKDVVRYYARLTGRTQAEADSKLSSMIR